MERERKAKQTARQGKRRDETIEGKGKERRGKGEARKGREGKGYTQPHILSM